MTSRFDLHTMKIILSIYTIMKTLKPFIVLLSTGIFSLSACQTIHNMNKQPQATAVTEVFGDGIKLTGIMINYPKVIQANTLDKSKFSVANRQILDVSPINQHGKKVDKSHQVIVQLNPQDSQASLLIKTPPSQPKTGNQGVGQAGDKKSSAPNLNTKPITLTANGETLTTTASKNLIVDDFKQFEYYDKTTGKTVKYNLYIPKNYQKNQSYPLILFMHDAGVTDSNPIATLIQGNGATSWASPEFQARHQAFVLAPQFDEIIADDNSKTSDYLDATIHLINHLKQTYNIDNKRIYTTGQSGGAIMSIAMNIKYPEFFTASYIT